MKDEIILSEYMQETIRQNKNKIIGDLIFIIGIVMCFVFSFALSMYKHGVIK